VATARGLFPDTTAAEREAVMNRRTERHKTGPLGVVLYRPQGADPMDWTVLARGFGIEFVGCPAAGPVGVDASAGGVSGPARRVPDGRAVRDRRDPPDSMELSLFPDAYVLALMIDGMVGWSLAGIAIAAIVKAPRLAATPA
jgi:hypothetical protein